MNTIHVMVGIQGSGKSTFSKKLSQTLNIKIVSTDVVRLENPGIKEEEVWPKVYQVCGTELEKGKDVIFDATSITPKVRARLVENVEIRFFPFRVGCYFFDVDPKLCEDRVVRRNTLENEVYLPPEIVYQYNQKLIPPTLDEGFSFIKVVNAFGEITSEMYKNEG